MLDAGRHLSVSSLYKEDSLELGHSSVWGSFWDASAGGSWGYACCKILQRRSPCPLAPQTDSKACDVSKKPDKPPEADAEMQLLRSSECFDDRAAFACHTVRWLLKEWGLRLRSSDPQLAGDELFGLSAQLCKAEQALEPLLQLLPRAQARLRKAQSAPKVLCERDDWQCPHCAYQNYGERITCRKCKRDDDLYKEPEEFPKVEQLLFEKVVQLLEFVVARDYKAATETFLELSIGHGRWNSEISGLTTSGAPTRKARAAQDHMRRQAAAMAPMDSPKAKLYLQWLKRLVTLAQLFLPNDDSSKNVIR
eukprot:TRINITY_DN89823_c0_g1_i1.p1 TRINITY_DN89823_c0_g1~~TRINITY_DN89823_c0_g1_i1.p1  ORF type:complete len:308 (-),score=57.12 TRINITY_DN89823_c0_g1_i1:30-953(-)